MSAIIKGVGDLLASVLEIFKGVITTIFGLFQSALNLVADLIKNIFGAAEGVIGFIIGNIFVIGTTAAVFFAYVLYQQRQGKTVTVGSKRSIELRRDIRPRDSESEGEFEMDIPG